MGFLDTIRRAKAYLEKQGRVSLQALALDLGLDDHQLDALIEELVDVQRVAALEGKVVSWIAPATPMPTAITQAAHTSSIEGAADTQDRRWDPAMIGGLLSCRLGFGTLRDIQCASLPT